MPEGMTRHESDMLDTARAFAREVIAPNAAAWERARTAPREAFEAAAGRGLCGLLVPAEDGGAGLGVLAMARVMEELAAADMAFAFGLVVHNNLAGNIARNGSKVQREAHLPDLMAARRIGAFLLTEPSGGSDAAAIRTVAQETGDGWTVTGRKAWVSNGAHADLLSVYAQTNPDAGWRGIACFLLDAAAPGVEREDAYTLLGGHALATNGFTFENAPILADGVLLPPGEGFKAAMAGIDIARINVAFMCCGMLRAALDTAVAYCREREAFGRRLADFQGLQWMLADVSTDLEAARQLARYAAERFEAGEDAAMAAAQAKKFATRVALSRLGDCMQVMGAEGFKTDTDHPLARHFAGAKMAQYLDGTTEIQNVVIARKLLAE